ncbi:MAG: hypothetical protein WED07_10305 [Candidatus Freyarchaeum deiterrae]
MSGLEKCPKCMGTGKIACATCKGLGVTDPHSKTICKTCGGTGKVICPVCKGTG